MMIDGLKQMPATRVWLILIGIMVVKLKDIL